MSGLDTSQDVTTDTVLEHEHEHDEAGAAAGDSATPAEIDDEAGGQATTA